MNNMVLIESYSEGKKISSRELSMLDYYEGSCKEIDDTDFIVSNKITKVVISIQENNECSYNFYNNGIPYKFVDLLDGDLKSISFCRKDNIFAWLDINMVFEKKYVSVKCEYTLKSKNKQLEIDVGFLISDRKQVLKKIKISNIKGKKVFKIMKSKITFFDLFFAEVILCDEEKYILT